MGGLNGRISKLEGRIPLPNDGAAELRRAEINAELDRCEARIRSMSAEELKAWRESPEQIAAREALEEEISRRRREGR